MNRVFKTFHHVAILCYCCAHRLIFVYNKVIYKYHYHVFIICNVKYVTCKGLVSNKSKSLFKGLLKPWKLGVRYFDRTEVLTQSRAFSGDSANLGMWN